MIVQHTACFDHGTFLANLPSTVAIPWLICGVSCPITSNSRSVVSIPGCCFYTWGIIIRIRFTNHKKSHRSTRPFRPFGSLNQASTASPPSSPERGERREKMTRCSAREPWAGLYRLRRIHHRNMWEKLGKTAKMYSGKRWNKHKDAGDIWKYIKHIIGNTPFRFRWFLKIFGQ